MVRLRELDEEAEHEQKDVLPNARQEKEKKATFPKEGKARFSREAAEKRRMS